MGCTDFKPTTTWKGANYSEIDGIVEIAILLGTTMSNLCTGSLIKENMVLTAGHCADENLYIIYGCNNIRHLSCKKISVKKIIKVPKWKSEFTSSNDLAIMIPERPIPLSLAKISNRRKIPTEFPIKVAGFGRRNYNSGILYEGTARVTQDYEFEFIAHMESSLDPNKGDSGGPALIFEDGEFKIIGVLSRRLSKTLKTSPYIGHVIYMKPIMYSDWIYEVYYDE